MKVKVVRTDAVHGIQLHFPSLTGNQPFTSGCPVGALTVGTDTPSSFPVIFFFLFSFHLYYMH